MTSLTGPVEAARSGIMGAPKTKDGIAALIALCATDLAPSDRELTNSPSRDKLASSPDRPHHPRPPERLDDGRLTQSRVRWAP
jgi:hypothetical protein